jgi:hypothetical protein
MYGKGTPSHDNTSSELSTVVITFWAAKKEKETGR